ncbi:MAG: type II secretion system minor pseudopilin GspI [Gammaproteobacteria bacterium]
MKNNAGFTLIEILIALAILAIALTAIIRATSQNIKDNAYLQNKTIATWVGTQVMNEARVNLIKLPEEPGKMEEETSMLGRKWLWQASTEPTANPQIKKLVVEVYEPTNNVKFSHLESFIYVS